MKKSSVFLFFSIICGTLNYIDAQSNADISKQIWIDVNPSYKGYPSIELFRDAGMLWEIENDGWIRLVLRPSMRIPIGKGFYFATGLGNFLQLIKLLITVGKFVPSRESLLPDRKVAYHYATTFDYKKDLILTRLHGIQQILFVAAIS